MQACYLMCLPTFKIVMMIKDTTMTQTSKTRCINNDVRRMINNPQKLPQPNTLELWVLIKDMADRREDFPIAQTPTKRPYPAFLLYVAIIVVSVGVDIAIEFIKAIADFFAD